MDASRIQNAATVLVQGSGRVTNARVTPAPKPKKNKSTLRRDNLKVINNGPRRTTPAPSPYKINSSNRFGWSDVSYEVVGFVAGAAGGCISGGAYLAPAGLQGIVFGCGLGAGLWATTGWQIGEIIDRGIESHEYQIRGRR